MSRRFVGPALAAALITSVLPLGAAAPASAAASAPVEAWERSTPGRIQHSSPVIADVDGDGSNDVVVGSHDGRIRAYRANGTNVPGFPQNVYAPGASSHTAIEASPAVADIDGDGKAEIVVGLGSLNVADQHGGVVVLNHDGSVHCRFRTNDFYDVWKDVGPFGDGYSEAVFGAPTIGDVDGDGRPDIVFGAWDLNIWAIDRSCNVLSGFPYWNDDTVWSSPALYDVDDDGRLEIFVGGDASLGGIENWPGGVFRALDVANGRVTELWKRRVFEIFQSSPAIGDIDGDGRPEVVTGTGTFYQTADSDKVFAFNLEDGTTVAGWPRSTGGNTFSSPALGDVDRDGRLDVVIGSRDKKVWAFRGDGSLLWSRDPAEGPAGGELMTSPVLSDLDGDGDHDVLVAGAAHVWFMRGHDGRRLYEPVHAGWGHMNAAAVGKVGSAWHVAAAGFHPGGGGSVGLYRIVTPASAPAWPMLQRTATHIGAPPSGGNPIPAGHCRRSVNPVARPLSSSGSGYWVLGRDGGVFSFGAPYYGSLPARGVRAKAQTLTATPSGRGYWIVDEHGGVHAFGDARHHGSMAGTALRGRILALEPAADGRGYWLLGSDGGVFGFGSARFHGSTGAMSLRGGIVSMRATPSGQGYWLLGSDGGVFSFGDAAFHGSTGAMSLAAPVISMSVHPSGRGYWLLGRDGGVFTFGSKAAFHGSVPGIGLCSWSQALQLRGAADGKGYWILGVDGGVFSFGSARYHGSVPGLGLAAWSPVRDMAVKP